jgi:hypothetical protein
MALTRCAPGAVGCRTAGALRNRFHQIVAQLVGRLRRGVLLRRSPCACPSACCEYPRPGPPNAPRLKRGPRYAVLLKKMRLPL